MDPSLIARVLWQRRVLRSHEHWTPRELRTHQDRALAGLRTFAAARSPFYRRVLTGLEGAPLSELPVLTKAILAESFDEIATDPVVRLDALREHLAGLSGDDRFAGRYRVAATSGSSGRQTITVSDAREWSTIIASYARASEWSGIRTGPTRRTRMVVVSSTSPRHQSARVATTTRSPFLASERLDASAPLPEIVARLNALRPEVLVGYASMMRILAGEQLEGRLRIRPRAVNSSSEVLTETTRVLIRQAFHVEPFDVYAATETGGIAAQCPQQGMHLFDDLVLCEVVDELHRPVPDGQTGDRLLVTVLSSRTLPLIRYELTDRVRLATRTCPCGRPFRLLHSVEGRDDDVLALPAANGHGLVPIHPTLLHRVLDPVARTGWQLHHSEDRLLVLASGTDPGFDPETIARALHDRLAATGALTPSIQVRTVDTIPTGASGKRRLIVKPWPHTRPS